MTPWKTIAIGAILSILLQQAPAGASTDPCRENDLAWREAMDFVTDNGRDPSAADPGDEVSSIFTRLFENAPAPDSCPAGPSIMAFLSLAGGARGVGPGRVAADPEFLASLPSDEKAFVIAHELAHGFLSHWRANMESPGDAERMRLFEFEADDAARALMAMSGFDPGGAVSLASRQASGDAGSAPSDTHPSWGERLLRMKVSP